MYDAKYQLTRSEQDLTGFQTSADIVNADLATTTLSSELTRLQQQSSDIALSLRLYERLKGYLESDIEVTESIAASSFDLNDPVVIAQLTEITSLNGQKSQKAATLGPEHPDVRRIELQINQTRESLKQQVRTAIQSTVIRKQEIDRQQATNQARFN